MALINGQFFGDIKGKVGGVVFSRNKAGKIMRQKVKGTDAKSGQQVVQRTRWSNAVSAWAILAGELKSAWGTFANSVFQPKKPKTTVAYTGFQAFTSLNASLGSAKGHDYGAIFTPTTLVATFEDFPESCLTPPIAAFSSMIQSSTGDAISLQLSSFTLDMTHKACVATLGMSPAPQATMPIFANPGTDVAVGFCFYASNIITPGANSTNNYDAFHLGSVNPVASATGWASASDFSFSWTIPDEYFNGLKNGLIAGNEVFITAYAVSEFGQQSRIGVIRVTIS